MLNDEQAIRQLYATWHQASITGDLQALCGLMAEEVVFLTAGHPPMNGRNTFLKLSEANSGRFSMDLKGDIYEIVIHENWAYCWGHLLVTITPNDGSAAKRRSGNTLTILHKNSDGVWVITRDANMLVAEMSA
jgi:uncharacterized protein (TIGR02246 family)